MKKVLTSASVVLIIIFGYLFYQYKFSPTKKSVTKQQFVSKTALDFTKETNKVVTKGEGANAYVVEINGRKADDTKKEFWAFYVNGKQAMVGAGSYKLKEGDKIEWKLENY